MEERDKKTELLVGLFMTVGLIMISLLVLQFGSVRDLFKGSYFLSVSFPNASGLKEASPVVLAGKRIGKVKNKPRHNETYTGVIIDLEIFQGEKIPANSVFTITTAGLMGDAYVDIEPPKHITDEFITGSKTDIIKGQEASGLSDLQSAAERIGKQISSVLQDDLKPALQDIKEAMSKVNKGALSDETINKFKNGISKLDATLTRVDDKVITDDNAKNLKDALADLKEAAASFKTASKNVEEGSKKLAPLLDKLESPIAKFDKVMTTADEAIQAVKTAATDFSITAKNITNSKGLLGALINDQRLRADFHDLIYNMKVNGPVLYSNTADKERARQEQEQKKQPPPAEAPKRKSLFGN